MVTTQAQLLSIFTDEIKMDPDRSVNGQSLIVRNLNAAQRKVQAQTLYGLPENQEVLVINLTGADITLPADFLAIAEPNSVKKDASSLLAPLDYNNILGTYDLTKSGQASGYYIKESNGSFLFNTYPLDGSGVVTIPYIKSLPEISSIQNLALPDDYVNAVVYYAIYLTLKRIRGYEQKAAEYMAYYKEEVQGILARRLSYSRHALKFGSPRGRFQYKDF
jgi:hypothetical protein